MANEQSKKKITDELLDELLNGEDPKEAFLNGGLIDDLKKAIAERALNAEMDVHLEQDDEQESGNHRNGKSRKRVLTDSGQMEVSIPRDRQGRFDPQRMATDGAWEKEGQGHCSSEQGYLISWNGDPERRRGA